MGSSDLAAGLSACIGVALLSCMPARMPTMAPEPVPMARAHATSSASASAVANAAVPPVARMAVVSESAPAAAIGMRILKDGGGSADAAIAAALAAGVAQPSSSGLGGGGFAMHWDGAQISVVDFRETAPIGIRVEEHGERPVRDGSRGVMIGVPGEVAGFAALSRLFGKMSRGELYKPAAELAESGFDVSPHLYRTLRWRQSFVLGSALATVLAPTGALLSRGDRAKNPALAATLRTIAAEGPAAFYRGVISSSLLEAARAHKSRLADVDLERYQAIVRQPLTTRWEGAEIHALPPPSGGGLMLVQTLLMHDKATLLAHERGAYLHVLAETFRGAIADRVRVVGDPDYVKMDMAALRDAARLRARRDKISLEETRAVEAIQLDDRGTANVIAADEDGNVTIITTSLHDMFGARVYTTAGFALNDTLAAFSIERDEQRFMAARRPNAPRGGARPVSSMSPTIVVRDGRVVMALAASGGSAIPSAVTQGVLERLVFGHDAQTCTSVARIDAPAGGGLRIDDSASPELLADLRRRGEVLDASRPVYSALNVVLVEDGKVTAAVDPRKGGAALVTE